MVLDNKVPLNLQQYPTAFCDNISNMFLNFWNKSSVCSWNLFVLGSSYEVNFYLPLKTTTSYTQHPAYLWTDTRLSSPKGKAARQWIYLPTHQNLWRRFSALLQHIHKLVFRHTGKFNLLSMAVNFYTDIFALVGCNAT